MVTHDPAAAAYADRVLFLADGRIVDEMAEPDGRAGPRADEGASTPAEARAPARTRRRRPDGADVWRTTCAACSRTSSAWRCPRPRDRARRRLRRRDADLHRHPEPDLQRAVRAHRGPTSTSPGGRLRRRASRPATGGPRPPTCRPTLVDEIVATWTASPAAEGDVQAEGVYILDADGEVLGHRRRAGHRRQLGRPTSALNPYHARRRRAPDAAPARSRSTSDGRRGRPATGSATRSPCSRPGPRVEAELVGIFTLRRRRRPGRRDADRLRHRDGAGAAHRSRTVHRHRSSVAADGVDADELRDRVAAALPRRLRGADRRASRPRSLAGRLRRGAAVHQHLPAGLRRRRAVRRHRSSSSTPSRCWSRSAPASWRCCARWAPAGAR